mgnify:FL=1
MSTYEVLAISNKPGEVTLKGFTYMKDRLPDDFEVCLIVEKDGRLSAGSWDTGLWSTENGEPGCFRQGRGGVIESDGVLAWLPIEEAAINIKGLWWNPEYRLISAFLDCVLVFAKDADDCLIIEYSGGAEEKVIFHMDVKTGNILAIDKNGRDEIPYLQRTFRAWYDDVKEKLLEDYYSGRYTVLGRTNMEGEISTEYKGSIMGKVL